MPHRALLILHGIAAAVWFGGLAVLLFGYWMEAWRSRDPRLLVDAIARIDRLGLPSLIVAAASGCVLAYHWLPELALWFNRELPHGAAILSKLSLLLLALLVYAYQRARVLPTLSPARIGRLGLCLALQLLLGVLLLIAGSAFRYSGYV
jgi:putative copper export protein